MTPNTPWISICIPTYNRAEHLRVTLESICRQNLFLTSHDLEVVVSDNQSTDDTQLLGEMYAARYPGKIKYLRQEVAVVPERNFELCLAAGSGRFLKLHNDTLAVRMGSFDEILKVIRATEAEQPVIFLNNGTNFTGAPIGVCNTFDEFIQQASYVSTWIGGFGVWREQLAKISTCWSQADTRFPHFPHTNALYEQVAEGRRAIILFDTYFDGAQVKAKSGYNLAEVFGSEYLLLLRKFIASGHLSQAVYEAEKKSILLKHTLPYYFDSTNRFEKTDFFAHMRDYKDDAYFYEAVEKYLLAPKAEKPPEADPRKILSMTWRQQNPHNETQLVFFSGDMHWDRFRVGRRSYGDLSIWAFGAANERLEIGSFVSIAGGVTFLLGGNHYHEGLSSFPFSAKYFGKTEAISKGPITLHDDVWIGFGATILSGVTIGKGAVVAAQSVVTKDIPAYSIVGGNPAKVIKYRFAPEVIRKLLDFDFSQLDDDKIRAGIDLLYTDLTADNVDALLQQLLQQK